MKIERACVLMLMLASAACGASQDEKTDMNPVAGGPTGSGGASTQPSAGSGGTSAMTMTPSANHMQPATGGSMQPAGNGNMLPAVDAGKTPATGGGGSMMGDAGGSR